MIRRPFAAALVAASRAGAAAQTASATGYATQHIAYGSYGEIRQVSRHGDALCIHMPVDGKPLLAVVDCTSPLGAALLPVYGGYYAPHVTVSGIAQGHGWNRRLVDGALHWVGHVACF